MFPRSGEEFTPWKNAGKVILSVLIVGMLIRDHPHALHIVSL